MTGPEGLAADVAWVEETGLAMLHEGEAVVSGVARPAVLGPLQDDALSTVEYVFPVEVALRVLPAEPADGAYGVADLGQQLRHG
ncbi:hypothetical protein [Modestobacter lapidis]|nr:hypothetical protein [Modestobacter lapidis]